MVVERRCCAFSSHGASLLSTSTPQAVLKKQVLNHRHGFKPSHTGRHIIRLQRPFQHGYPWLAKALPRSYHCPFKLVRLSSIPVSLAEEGLTNRSNIESISESSSTSTWFGGSPWFDIETSSLYGTQGWNSNSSPVLWSGTSLPRNSDNYHFQPPNGVAKIKDFSKLQESDNSRYVQIQHRKSSIPRQYNCGWLGCIKSGSLSNVEEWKLHMKDHARIVRTSWRPSEPCCWYGCPSKARHKTAKLFEDHLNNIHINPLLCTVDGCNHKTPFRGKADLQRHINCVHIEGSKAKCPFLSCRSEGRDFSRKDKLIIHLRDAHDTDPCPFAHCVVVLDPRIDSTAKHIAKLHGEFECALGSCKQFVSSFCDSGLLEHLQLDHKMDWGTVLKARDIAKNVENKTLRDEHVMRAEVYNCSICHTLGN